jgi:opacity protein-like surface antigen
MKILNLLGLTGILFFSSALYAAEENSNEDASRSYIKAKHHKEGNLYVVTKGLVTLGDTYTEKGEEPKSKLKGGTGGGVGIDLGYRLGYGFATELDFAYAHTTVTKSVVGEKDINAGADYYSYGIDLIYGYHINEEYVLFGKVGWELEQENISKYNINGTNNGFSYAAGFEYGITEHWAFVGEYEGNKIDGPLGDNIFAGASYTF